MHPDELNEQILEVCERLNPVLEALQRLSPCDRGTARHLALIIDRDLHQRDLRRLYERQGELVSALIAADFESPTDPPSTPPIESPATSQRDRVNDLLRQDAKIGTRLDWVDPASVKARDLLRERAGIRRELERLRASKTVA